MKKPFIIMIAAILGIILTNVFMAPKTTVSDSLVEDNIGTSMSADKPL